MSPYSAPEPAGVRWVKSPYYSSRGGETVSGIILHYTVGGSLDGTVRWFQDNPSKVSSHYVVGKDGDTVQMVNLADSSNHAGKSRLPGCRNVNHCTIGIEIVNWGPLTPSGGGFKTGLNKPYHGLPPVQTTGPDSGYWEPFTDSQYNALAGLILHATARFPTIQYITGHEHIAPGRKHDPGPAFDWDRLASMIWPDYSGQIGPLTPSSGASTATIAAPYTAPAMPSPSIDVHRAVRLNRRYARTLGWDRHFDAVASVVGFTDMSPDEQKLAQAVASWQAANGLTADGIIGPNTWQAMNTLLPV